MTLLQAVCSSREELEVLAAVRAVLQSAIDNRDGLDSAGLSAALHGAIQRSLPRVAALLLAAGTRVVLGSAQQTQRAGRGVVQSARTAPRSVIPHTLPPRRTALRRRRPRRRQQLLPARGVWRWAVLLALCPPGGHAAAAAVPRGHRRPRHVGRPGLHLRLRTGRVRHSRQRQRAATSPSSSTQCARTHSMPTCSRHASFPTTHFAGAGTPRAGDAMEEPARTQALCALLRAGADPFILDSRGVSALEYAQHNPVEGARWAGAKLVGQCQVGRLVHGPGPPCSPEWGLHRCSAGPALSDRSMLQPWRPCRLAPEY